MKFAEKLTDKALDLMKVSPSSEWTPHDRRGIRLVSNLGMAALAAPIAYSLHRFGVRITDLESIMPFSTTSDSWVAESVVDAANNTFAAANLGLDVAAMAVGSYGVVVLNEIRKRCSEDIVAQASEAQ